MEKEKLLEKLEQLQERIEAWIQINGYGNLSNYKERKNKDGKVVWKQSDWEFVDGFYNAIYNDDEFWYSKDTLKELNRIWKRYIPYPDVNLWTEFMKDISWLETQ